MTDIASDGASVLPEFRIGTIVSQTFSTLFSNIFKILGVGLLVYVPVYALMAFLGLQSSQTGTIDPSQIYMMILPMVFMMIAAYVAQTAIVYAAVESLAGKSATFGKMLSTGLRYILPVIGATLIITVLYSIGVMLLVIPGIIVLLMLSVTVPVIVAENKSVFEALKRSAELTKGYRWQILGAFIVTFLALWLLMVGIMLVGGLLTALVGTLGAVVMLALSALTGAVSFGLMGTVTASIYTNLRAAKEGTSVDEIAQVFA